MLRESARAVGARSVAVVALRLIAAAGLGVDAGVHANLASLYEGVGRPLSEGDLFLVEAGFACLAAIAVLVGARGRALIFVLLVASSALAALLLSRYVDLGSLGPIPNLYEPAWYGDKTLAAVAEATTGLASLALLFLSKHTKGRSLPMKKRHVLPVAIASLLVAGAGIGVAASSATSGAGPSIRSRSTITFGPHATAQRVTIVGNARLRFDPSTVRVRVGKVHVTLKDSGAYPHNVVVPALKFTSPSVTGDPGGTVVSFTLDFRHKGRYRFYCQYHESAGMVGTFVVS